MLWPEPTEQGRAV